MLYEEKEVDKEIVLVVYYNVLFYLIFRVELDEYKKGVLVERINSGEKMMMKNIYEWCQNQQVQVKMKFRYRKDFPIIANMWNLYSYFRFRCEMKIRH